MEIILERILESHTATLGLIYLPQGDVFTCLEDRQSKSNGATDQARIPAGNYPIIKRNFGRFYKAYHRRYGHKHVYEITSVPDFTDVLFHTGNSHSDTRGCILIGQSMDMEQMTIGKSRQAYMHFYSCLSQIFHAQEKHENLLITIINKKDI